MGWGLSMDITLLPPPDTIGDMAAALCPRPAMSPAGRTLC